MTKSLNKMRIIICVIILVYINAHANENWIKIQPQTQTQTKTKKPATNIDINLSQIKPLNSMIQKANLIKQLLNATKKKDEDPTITDKNWFILQTK